MLTPILVFSLWYGMDSIVVFDNNKTLPNGEHISYFLDTSQYPIEPYAIGNNNGQVVYACSCNISQVFVKEIGFYIMDQPLYNILINNLTMYSQLSSLVYVLQQFYPLGYDPASQINTDITSNLLYPYLKNNSITVVVGDYLGDNPSYAIQSVKFRVTAGKYIIPLCELVFLMKDFTTYSVVGLWKNPLTDHSIAMVSSRYV